MNKIELGKTYRTRDGREVRIYAVDGGGEFPVHGAITMPNSKKYMEQWTSDGRTYATQQSDSDLIEARPRIKRTVWLNVYRQPHVHHGAYSDKALADDNSAIDRIACVKVEIDVEEGEGL